MKMSEPASNNDSRGRPHIFVVVGEETGDRLGGALIKALRARTAKIRELPELAGAKWRRKG